MIQRYSIRYHDAPVSEITSLGSYFNLLRACKRSTLPLFFFPLSLSVLFLINSNVFNRIVLLAFSRIARLQITIPRPEKYTVTMSRRHIQGLYDTIDTRKVFFSSDTSTLRYRFIFPIFYPNPEEMYSCRCTRKNVRCFFLAKNRLLPLIAGCIFLLSQ